MIANLKSLPIERCSAALKGRQSRPTSLSLNNVGKKHWVKQTNNEKYATSPRLADATSLDVVKARLGVILLTYYIPKSQQVSLLISVSYHYIRYALMQQIK